MHTWPYWEWGLQVVWPRWLEVAAADVPAPAAFSYRSIEPTWSVYGWDVALERDVLEFGGIEVTAPTAFTLTGSGHGVVVTPAAFRPRGSYRVVVGEEETTIRADSRGRLRIEVDLGPSHTAQQFTPVALAAQTLQGKGYFTSVPVRISAALEPAAPVAAPPSPEVPAGTTLPSTGGGSAGVLLLTLALLGVRARHSAPRGQRGRC